MIIGTGGRERDLQGRLIYAMRVTEKIEFSNFWSDPRFAKKKPKLTTSMLSAYGDNIYQPDPAGGWIQHDSHHSLAGGVQNSFNKNKDTGTNHVLISDDFVYYGRSAFPVPVELRQHLGYDLCASTQGHISRFPREFVEKVHAWFIELPDRGVLGLPVDWD